MSYISTTDAGFLATLNRWLAERGEILVLIRYSHAAGSKDIEFFRSSEALAAALRKLPPRACVTAFRQPQLPIRGVVDDRFIAACLGGIPDGAEYLVVETVRRTYGALSWFHSTSGESHVELLEDLESLRGSTAAAGLYPAWLLDHDDVISAVVPGEDGIVRVGAY